MGSRMKDQTTNPFSPEYQSQLKKDTNNRYVPNRELKQYPTDVFANIAPKEEGKQYRLRKANI